MTIIIVKINKNIQRVFIIVLSTMRRPRLLCAKPVNSASLLTLLNLDVQ